MLGEGANVMWFVWWAMREGSRAVPGQSAWLTLGGWRAINQSKSASTRMHATCPLRQRAGQQRPAGLPFYL